MREFIFFLILVNIYSIVIVHVLVAHEFKQQLTIDNNFNSTSAEPLFVRAFKCQLCQYIFHETTRAVHFNHSNAVEHAIFKCNKLESYQDLCKSFVSQYVENATSALFNTHERAICEKEIPVCDFSNEAKDFNDLRSIYKDDYYKKSRTSIVPQDQVIGPRGVLNLNFNDASIDRFLPESDAEKRLVFLATYGVIMNQVRCPDLSCDNFMVLIASRNTPDGFIWRCKGCPADVKVPPTRSIRYDTFMYSRRISWNTWFKLLYRWSEQPKTPYATIHRELNVDEGTVTDVYCQFRDIASVWIEMHQTQNKLGGPGRIVEIDESMFFRRKYNRGRWHKQTWVFGGVERGTNKVFMEPVEKRDRVTLFPIIYEHIANNSIIMTDGWRAYFALGQDVHNYVHHWVNHKYNFVDPTDDEIHTQSVEATWGAVKKTLKHLYGTSKALFPSYLDLYVFRRAHNNQKIMQYSLYWFIYYYNPENL